MTDCCTYCGRSLPAGDEKTEGWWPRVGSALLIGRWLLAEGAEPVLLPPTQANILSRLSARPAGINADILAGVLGIDLNNVKTQVTYLRRTLDAAGVGVTIPKCVSGPGNHAFYRLASGTLQ